MQFEFRPFLTIFSLIGLAILLTLGTWQVQRLSWKQDLIAKIEARVSSAPIPFEEAYRRWRAGEDMEYTPVTARLAFDHSKEAHVFGTWEGAIGWYVFTPSLAPLADLNAEDAELHLYVNRGFVPELFKELNARPELTAGADTILITGLFRSPQKAPAIAGSLAPEDNPEKNQWHQRSPKAFASVTSFEALPVWIDSAETASAGEWPKGGTTRVTFNNRHLEYALTWYGLALTLLVVYGAFTLKRSENE